MCLNLGNSCTSLFLYSVIFTIPVLFSFLHSGIFAVAILCSSVSLQRYILLSSAFNSDSIISLTLCVLLFSALRLNSTLYPAVFPIGLLKPCSMKSISFSNDQNLVSSKLNHPQFDHSQYFTMRGLVTCHPHAPPTSVYRISNSASGGASRITHIVSHFQFGIWRRFPHHSYANRPRITL